MEGTEDISMTSGVSKTAITTFPTVLEVYAFVAMFNLVFGKLLGVYNLLSVFHDQHLLVAPLTNIWDLNL
mgnify:CR=1 FL=1